MQDNEALVTFDWAMKFLPRKYGEGQVDCYAKQGINWHISVTLMMKRQTFESITHVHNAACYKLTTTLTQIYSGLGALLETYNFSEA